MSDSGAQQSNITVKSKYQKPLEFKGTIRQKGGSITGYTPSYRPPPLTKLNSELFKPVEKLFRVCYSV